MNLRGIRMNRKSWKSIFIISTVSVLFIISFCLFNQFIKDRVNLQIESSLENLSTHNIDRIQKEVESNFKVLRGIASKMAKQNIEQIPEEEIKMQVHKIYLNGIYSFQNLGFATKDGMAYVNYGNKTDIRTKDYFKQSIQGQESVMRIIDTPNNGTMINVYSVPVKKQDKIIGVVFAIYDDDIFSRMIKDEVYEGQGQLYLVNQQGVVMESFSKTPFKEQENMFDVLLQGGKSKRKVQKLKQNFQDGKQGFIQHRIKGKDYCSYYSPIPMKDWWLGISVPCSVFDSHVIPILIGSEIMCIFSLSIVFGSIFLFYKKMNKNQKYLTELAYIDPLTEGYNKTYLKDIWIKEMEKHQKQSFWILAFNIQKFHIINEIYGVKMGDELLKYIYSILKTQLHQNGIVVRNQADEFILLCHYDNEEELIQWMENLIQEIYESTQNKMQVKIEVSIGVYKIYTLAHSFEKIYNCANTARKSARKKNVPYTFFSDDMRNYELQQKELEDLLDRAIEEREFKAWFQPKYDTKKRNMIGAEALVRWHKDDGTLVPPNQFIPLCEETGRILKVDRIVFEDVCYQLKQWMKQEKEVVPISVNISRAYLENSEVVEYLKNTVDRYQVPSKYVQLEITESSLIENEKALEEMIQRMHKIGFRVLLDDYGVGYSSLKSINSMNFDTLKIDKSFIDTIGTPKGSSIVRHTVALASSLGMKSVAEGVETEEQYRFLNQCGCDEIQGYYFSKPLPAKEFELLLGVSG